MSIMSFDLPKGLPDGPWTVDHDIRDGMDWNNHITDVYGDRICFMAHSGTSDNSKLAAAARAIVSIPDLVAEIERLRGEVTDIQTKLDGWKIAERMVSAAYVRLRGIIPDALDTPHAPSPEQVWVTTEKAASDMVAEIERQAAEIRQKRNNEINDCDLLGVHEREIERIRGHMKERDAEIERLRDLVECKNCMEYAHRVLAAEKARNDRLGILNSELIAICKNILHWDDHADYGRGLPHHLERDLQAILTKAES